MASVWTFGCSEDNPPPTSVVSGATPYLARTTPANVVVNFERAYEERNLGEYMKLFAHDFLMESDQVPEGYWTRDRERTAARNMFEISSVDTVILNFVTLDPQPTSEPNEVEIGLEELLLLVQDTITGSYRLQRRSLQLVLRENREILEEDAPTWEIRRWIPGDAPGTDTTWVDVKYHYFAICPTCR